MSNRPPITLDTLRTGDRTRFQLCSGDEETPATITIAEVKELVVAVNWSIELIQDLHKRLTKAEERINELEATLHMEGL